MRDLLEPPTRLAVRRRPPRRRRGFRRLLTLLLGLVAASVVWRSGLVGDLLTGDGRSPAPARESQRPRERPGPQEGTSSSPQAPSVPATGPINTAFPGLTTFRGNATRTYYGEGPVPEHPRILWRYPRTGGMCMSSVNLGVRSVWCGMGWTGQPNVIEHPDGRIEVRFGAYDGRYHFLDGRTGKPMRPDLVTEDLAKGSATSDPDGYPLYYAGSRDNYLRVVALDRKKPTVLWKLGADSAPHPVWNDDWDGAPLVLGDYLLEGGENSWFYVVKLNRHYDDRGKVQVDPKVVMLVPGYDDRLLRDVGDRDVSIESSVAFYDGVAYFVNSGGLVQGWDVSDVLRGGDRYRRVFRFWNGNDSDATVVIDEEGFLYVARHGQRPNRRSEEVGDLMKLDPRRPKRPLVWSLHVTAGSNAGGGIWSTPALYEGMVYVTTNNGDVLVVDRDTGRVVHSLRLPGPLWSSPVTVDDRLLVGDCDGVLHAFDISDPSRPPREVWRVQLEGCIEATPAVWKGMIFVGARGGAIYGIGDSG